MEGRALDRVGMVLFAATGLWTVVASTRSGGNPLPATALLLAAAAVLFGTRRGLGAPWVPAAAAAVVVMLAVPGILSLVARGRPGLAPLGYANANGALFLQGSVASLLAAAPPAPGRLRVGGWAAAGGLAAMAAASSRATAVLLLLVVLALLVGHRRGWVRAGIAAAALAFVVAAIGVTVVASEGPVGSVASRAEAAFGDRRVALWGEAYGLMAAHPVLGVGPQRFQLASPTARSDPDARWAHADFLQQGAETGIPGMLLLSALFVWGFARLWGSAAEGRPVALAAASLGALGVQASADHLLESPLIPLVASSLVGAASMASGAEEFQPGPILRKMVKAAVLPMGAGSRLRPGDLAILLYHRVGTGDREVDLPMGLFEAQVAELAEGGAVRSLDDALADGSPGGLVVTFDDGYRDFHEVVLPILDRHRVPAVLYLATGLVAEEGGRDSGMSWSQLREAVDTGLVTVGSHTHSHVDLARTPPPAGEEEIRRSQDLIEQRLQVQCRHFSYPFGSASPSAEPTVRKLFATAALRWETNRRGRFDRYRLGRTPLLRSDGMWFFRAKMRGRLDAEAWVYRAFGRGPWR